MEQNKIRLICYGGGEGFLDFQIHLDQERAEIVGIIDRNDVEVDYPILEATRVREIAFDYAVICSRNHRDEMAETLLAEGVPLEKIVAAPNCARLDMAYQDRALMRRILKPTAVTGNLVWGHILPFEEYDDSDYIRKAVLALVAEMLKKRGVEGALAEVGVCTGAFSRLMSELFPERDIYLFDTFEGFDPRDLKRADEFDRYKIRRLKCDVKETTVEYVLSHMPFRERCIVRKGYFPETAAGMPEDIRFSLVSLDADLYNPTIAGLEYFYPRMANGGVIMVHDYNSFWGGIASAVDEFAEKYALFPLVIPDECGSALFIHP